jgi:hypothetical protein
VFETAGVLRDAHCFREARVLYAWVAGHSLTSDDALAAADLTLDALNREAAASPDFASACFAALGDLAGEWRRVFPAEAERFERLRCEALRATAAREAEHDRERASQTFERVYRDGCPRAEYDLSNAVLLTTDAARSQALGQELRSAFPTFERVSAPALPSEPSIARADADQHSFRRPGLAPPQTMPTCRLPW